MTDAAFPGREATVASAGERCVAEFEGFVGLSYQESNLDLAPITPERRELGGGRPRRVLRAVRPGSLQADGLDARRRPVRVLLAALALAAVAACGDDTTAIDTTVTTEAEVITTATEGVARCRHTSSVNSRRCSSPMRHRSGSP